MTLIHPSQFQELTEQESELRPRLELRVERALFQAAVVLQEPLKQIPHDSPHYSLKDYWRNQNLVKRAFGPAAKALGELRSSQLYRSTHRYFEPYYRHL